MLVTLAPLEMALILALGVKLFLISVSSSQINQIVPPSPCKKPSLFLSKGAHDPPFKVEIALVHCQWYCILASIGISALPTIAADV